MKTLAVFTFAILNLFSFTSCKKEKNITYTTVYAKDTVKKESFDIQSVEWNLVKINGEQPAHKSEQPISLSFAKEQKQVMGYAGCNRYNGAYTINEQSLEISQMMTTKMLCDPMQTEYDFIKLLSGKSSFAVVDSQLILTKDQAEVLVFEIAKKQ